MNTTGRVLALGGAGAAVGALLVAGTGPEIQASPTLAPAAVVGLALGVASTRARGGQKLRPTAAGLAAGMILILVGAVAAAWLPSASAWALGAPLLLVPGIVLLMMNLPPRRRAEQEGGPAG
jgi:uncharacterized membrane protein YfcA